MEHDAEQVYLSLARLSEQEAARDFKEAAIMSFLAGVATLVSYELADNIPNEIVSESTSNTILVLGTAATATVLIAGFTAGYLRRREAKEYHREAQLASAKA